MRHRLILALAAFAVLATGCSHPVRPSPPPPAPASAVPSPSPEAEPPAPLDAERQFAVDTARTTGIPAEQIEAWLAQARYQPAIIAAITRPAESKPWSAYRPIFLTDARIRGGRDFLAAHRDELAAVQARTGVPAEIVVAIIGVETNYGGNTGSYRVLDALYTLGFFYPKRADFFRGELAQLFPLARDEKLDLATLRGSYAGAMGWGQFMPSSYRAYAMDGDGDGRRDLFGSPRDVFASVANYFVAHGWQKDQPVFVAASADAGAVGFVPDDYQPRYTLADLAGRGFRPTVAGAPDLPVTLLTLDGAAGPEYWLGYRNFYVLTRYNRSPLYAMAVYQLAQAIAAPAPDSTPAPAPAAAPAPSPAVVPSPTPASGP